MEVRVLIDSWETWKNRWDLDRKKAILVCVYGKYFQTDISVRKQLVIRYGVEDYELLRQVIKEATVEYNKQIKRAKYGVFA